MTEIIPAIIPQSLEDLKEHLERVKKLAPRVQIDVIDGEFAPEASFPFNHPESLKEFETIATEEKGLPLWEDFDFEVDLMVKKPEKYIDAWMDAGVTALIIHVGSTKELGEIIKKAKKKLVEIGVAVKPSKPNEDIEDWVDSVDFVQFMGNDEIGFHGKELDEAVYQKIMDLKEDHPDVKIAVDIGVNEETAPLLVDAGADKLVSGSAIFEAEDIEEAIMSLKASDS